MGLSVEEHKRILAEEREKASRQDRERALESARIYIECRQDGMPRKEAMKEVAGFSSHILMAHHFAEIVDAIVHHYGGHEAFLSSVREASHG